MSNIRSKMSPRPPDSSRDRPLALPRVSVTRETSSLGERAPRAARGEARRAARAVSKIMRMALFRHHHTVIDYDSAMFSYYHVTTHTTQSDHIDLNRSHT